MLATDERAWMFHRGRWRMIKNPLYGKETPDANDRRRTLQEYRRKWWKLGPTFLYPNYSGILVYTYAYTGGKNFPEYLIWINALGPKVAIYAQDLPDLLEILALLAPLVFTDIFVDIYRRSRGEE